MVNVTIDEAKAIAKRHNCEGVIVLAFDGTEFSVTSYGQTKVECARYREVGRQIHRDISRGFIEIQD